MTARLCCAYLRAYQPIEAFTEAEREQLACADTSTHPAGAGRHALGLIAPEETKEIYHKVVDGRTYLCPAQTHLRSLLGMLAFERSLPDGVRSVFFSEQEVEAAEQEIEAIRAQRPDLRPAIVQSAWHVPLRWFICFDISERRIEQAGDHPTIRYESTVGEARRRVGEALETLKGGIVHPVIVGMIYELNEWLAMFDGCSILELDYASVATLFDPDELADDRSAADVRNAIEALGDRDGMKAGLYYQRANERWMRARQRESLN